MRGRVASDAQGDQSLAGIRIAHVATVDLSLRYMLFDLLRDLTKTGAEVVGISAPGPGVPAIEAAGIRHIAVPMTRRAFSPLEDLRSLWCLYRVLRRGGFTIVHTHTPKPGLLGRLAARLAHVPVIVHTNHGFVFHDGSPWLWRRLFVALERAGDVCSDLTLSVNHEDIETAIRERISDASKFVPIGRGGLGVDLAKFDASCLPHGRVAAKRDELGLPREARVVGFVGRLVREKGLPELLEALRAVRDAVPEVRLLVVGPVDSIKRDALTPSIAEEYGLSDICVFTGLREDMPELYAVMDVLVLPSHREGFGLVLAEASAMGVPVIASNVRGCREAVEDGRNGLLVPPQDAAALASAVLQILTNRDMARRMGEEGRRLAVERFDQQMVFQRVRAEYERLLQKKGLLATRM